MNYYITWMTLLEEPHLKYFNSTTSLALFNLNYLTLTISLEQLCITSPGLLHLRYFSFTFLVLNLNYFNLAINLNYFTWTTWHVRLHLCHLLEIIHLDCLTWATSLKLLHLNYSSWTTTIELSNSNYFNQSTWIALLQ